MIKLFDDWVIRIDEYNYILAKVTGTYTDKKTCEEKTNYKVCGYFGTVEAALKALVDILSREELRQRESTLTEAVAAIKKTNEKVMQYLCELERRTDEQNNK